MSYDLNRLNSLQALRDASLRAKGYTASQIAALAETLESIVADINASLEVCESHVESHANAEENVIVSIKKNGVAIAPENKIVNIVIPVKVSDLTNDTGFATSSDISEAVAGAGHLKKEVVDALPSVSDADANTIYYVRQNNAVAGKQYKEYQLINGAFELIGSDEPDLSGYATHTYVEKADNALITSLFNTLAASDDKYVGTANLALFWSLVKPLITNNDVTDLAARVELLELAYMNGEITGNPFYITFDNLDGVSVMGVWNTESDRIEF